MFEVVAKVSFRRAVTTEDLREEYQGEINRRLALRGPSRRIGILVMMIGKFVLGKKERGREAAKDAKKSFSWWPSSAVSLVLFRGDGTTSCHPSHTATTNMDFKPPALH